MFIFPTEDILKQKTADREKVLTLQKPVQLFFKKNSEY